MKIIFYCFIVPVFFYAPPQTETAFDYSIGPLTHPTRWAALLPLLVATTVKATQNKTNVMWQKYVLYVASPGVCERLHETSPPLSPTTPTETLASLFVVCPCDCICTMQ